MTSSGALLGGLITEASPAPPELLLTRTVAKDSASGISNPAVPSAFSNNLWRPPVLLILVELLVLSVESVERRIPSEES